MRIFARSSRHSRQGSGRDRPLCRHLRPIYGQDRDTKDVLAAWMSGYFNAAKNQSMVDLTRFERNRKAVETYCKKHKLETLMSAIQRNVY